MSKDLLSQHIKIPPEAPSTFTAFQPRNLPKPILLAMLSDPPEEVSAKYDESLRIELLQLTTLFLKYL